VISVQPDWCLNLPLQQQSVLLLAARGPDGIPKPHPCKDVQRAYRGTVLVAAARQRTLHWGEKADSFMSLDGLAGDWDLIVKRFFESVDELPHHFVMHLLHGAEILGYHHPDRRFRERWLWFYFEGCNDMHVQPETQEQLDERLNDVFPPEREASWPPTPS
jgi:hypothetical protein